MTNEAHFKALQAIAHEYGGDAYQQLADKIHRDGFSSNNNDAIALVGMSVQTINTLHLVALSVISVELAQKTRDLMIEQLQASKEWL